MSTALVQDPSGSTLPIQPESALSNGDDLYSPNVVVQPISKASHSRQSSAAKRKRAQSGMDITGNLVETAQIEVNGHDKSKRQKLDSRASSTKLVPPNGYPLQPVAEEGFQFKQTYVSPWTQTQPPREHFIEPTGAKEREHEMKGHSTNSTVVQDVKPTADSAEQTNSFPTAPNFQRVFLGNKIIEPWYFSPYPPGDIAIHALNPTVPVHLFNWDHHQAARFSKGQPRKSHGGVNPGAVNGYVTNGAGPSRGTTRQELPSHASGITLYVCQRCFVYSDRPIRSPDQSPDRGSSHDATCFSHLPGELVYDDQEQSAEGSLDAADRLPLQSFADGSSYLNEAPQPPKQEKEARVRIYEVDPVISPLHKTFCKNITLFGKFFIDSKSIVFDCSTFLYYIITIVEAGAESIAGFFTKEKESVEEYNLACIIVFPPWQRKGLGRLLIQFSYELSKQDGKIGSPEKPLSTLGTRSYSPVWVTMVLDYLYEQIAIPYEMSLDRPKGNAKRHPIPLGTSRILKSKHITSSGYAMETHLSFSCSLEQIAAGAYLTASDASFALAELGLQKYITGFNQDDAAASSPKTASGSSADGPSGSGEVEASQATLSTFGPPLDEIFPDGAHGHPPTETVASSARELKTTVTEPEVPIITRDFIRLLGEKASFRRKPINKEFVLL